MKRLSLLFAVLFLAFTVEASANALVLAGRWFISSRYASLTLAAVKRLLDAGIIARSTAWIKTLIQRNGKWILLTLGLSEILQELDNIQQTYTYCYTPVNSSSFVVSASYNSSGVPVIGSVAGGNQYWQATALGSGCSGSGSIPAHQSYFWDRSANVWRAGPRVPVAGIHRVGNCDIQVVLKIEECSFPYSGSSTVNAPAPSLDDRLAQRRDVEVQVFPNVSDFIREDVIAQNPDLAYLRDEYQRILADNSIPMVQVADLGDVILPDITWDIPASESVDVPSSDAGSSSGSSSGSASGSGSATGSGSNEGSGSLDYPNLDSSVEVPAKRSFPSSLVNALVSAHPILRALSSVRLELGNLQPACRLQDGMFVVDFCPYEWVFRSMGVVIVFVAYLVPFVGIGRGD
jgi:uncharacterized membrane protein YgcG